METMSIADAIDQFLAELALGQAERTVRTYGTALGHFLTYLEQVPLPSTDTLTTQRTVDHAIDYVHFLVGEHFGGDVPKSTPVNGRGLPAYTGLRTYLMGIARFYRWLVREDLAYIPARDAERMREAYRNFRKGYSRPLPKPPEEEVIEALIRAARSVPSDPEKRRADSFASLTARLRRLRDIAIVETLRATGVRVGELVALRRGDLDVRHQTVRVAGKGGQERLAYFDGRAWNAVQAYLATRDAGTRGRGLDTLPVFARHDKRAGKRTLPLSTNSVRNALDRLIQAAGLEEAVTPHSFRHFFATKVLDKTGDLAVTQDFLGHASPETTRIYAKVSDKRLREAHRVVFEE